MTEPDRNAALALAVTRIIEFAAREIATATSICGKPIDFYVTANDGTDYEGGGQVSDYDNMADTLGEIVGAWLDEGLFSEVGDEGDNLFTATFDPQKVRPS